MYALFDNFITKKMILSFGFTANRFFIYVQVIFEKDDDLFNKPCSYSNPLS